MGEEEHPKRSNRVTDRPRVAGDGVARPGKGNLHGWPVGREERREGEDFFIRSFRLLVTRILLLKEREGGPEIYTKDREGNDFFCLLGQWEKEGRQEIEGEEVVVESGHSTRPEAAQVLPALFP